MRRFVAGVLVSWLVFASTPLTFAAAQSTGTITGVARSPRASRSAAIQYQCEASEPATWSRRRRPPPAAALPSRTSMRANTWSRS